MHTAENKTVSVIIPVYNVADYLDECLQSVTAQTYTNIEIILINDGSTDTSLSICNEWQKKDGRIKVINNINRGVSYTRNIGIENAAGDYFIFVDSDDIISENHVEVLLSLLERSGADIAITTHCCFKKNQKAEFVNSDEYTVWERNLETAFFTVTQGMVSSKLYKKDIILEHNVRFDETIAVCEDLAFNFAYVKHCRSAAVGNAKLYGYRQRPNSAAHNTVSPKWFTCLKVYRYFFENYSENNAYTYIVYYYLKILYEADYMIKHKTVSDSKVDIQIDIKNEIKSAERKRNILSKKELLKLFICKYFFIIVKKRRK